MVTAVGLFLSLIQWLRFEKCETLAGSAFPDKTDFFCAGLHQHPLPNHDLVTLGREQPNGQARS